MAGPVIQVERYSRHPGRWCLFLFCSPASLAAQASLWSLLVQTGPEPRHLSFHSAPTPAWLSTEPAKNWSSLGERIVISNRAKPAVGKTSTCLCSLCISLPAVGLHGRSLPILFGSDSRQKLLGKWREVPSSLNCPFSLWYVFPSVFPFSCYTLFLRRDVDLKKTSPPLPKLLLLFTQAEVSVLFAAELTVVLQRGWGTVLPRQGRFRRSKVSFLMPWSLCDK